MPAFEGKFNAVLFIIIIYSSKNNIYLQKNALCYPVAPDCVQLPNSPSFILIHSHSHMKKTFLALSTLTLFAGTAHAQLHSHSDSFVGVKVGGSAATFIGDQAKYLRFAYGFNAGVFANLALNRPFSLQPELLFSMKGVQAQAGVSDVYVWLNYVDIPVALRATANAGFYAEAGPQVGFLITARTDATGEKVNVKDAYRAVDLGYLLGVGYQPPKGGLGVGGRYNGSFLSVFKAPEDGTDAADLRNSVFQVYLTYSPTHYHKPKKKQ